MSYDAHANFAGSTVATAPSPATTGTSLVVAAGHGTRFPAVPFNAVICPFDAGPSPVNAEVVRVTLVSTDTFTIVREQESSTARTVVVGDRIFNVATAKAFTDLETGKLETTAQAADVNPAGTSIASALSGKAATSQKLDDFGAPDDNTDLNASTTAHGLLVKATAPTAGLRNVVAIDNAETAYTNKALFDATNPEALGTVGPGSAMAAARRDHVHANPAIDTLAAPTDITTLDASTTAHGLLVKATAPASGLLNVVGIANGETAYTNKALFDATAPAALGTAATGSAMTAARRDHVHDRQTAVTLAEMADLDQDKFIIRTTASTGVPETATCTAAARTLLDDATVLAMQQTLNPLTLNTQTDSYTLALSDAGKHVEMNKGTANTLTVPKNSVIAFPVGTTILCSQLGAGLTTVAPVDGDVTINSRGAALKSAGQHAAWALEKTGTDTWLMSGDISA